MSDIDRAIDALRDYEQADEDGVVVLASRQAIEEVLSAFTDLQDRTGTAEARCAAMRGALEKASVLDVGRPIPRDGSERAYVQGVLAGHDQARKYVREIARTALSDDTGAKVLAVVDTWRAMTDAERDYCVAHLSNLGDQEGALGKALAALEERDDG